MPSGVTNRLNKQQNKEQRTYEARFVEAPDELSVGIGQAILSATEQSVIDGRRRPEARADQYGQDVQIAHFQDEVIKRI